MDNGKLCLLVDGIFPYFACPDDMRRIRLAAVRVYDQRTATRTLVSCLFSGIFLFIIYFLYHK